jgi:hypothetical protein
LLKTLEASINAFGTFNQIIEERWLQIPKKWLEEDVIEEDNNNNTTNEAFGRKLFLKKSLGPQTYQDQNSFKSTTNYCRPNNESSSHYGCTFCRCHTYTTT